ncbi:MAG: PqqD family protein [Flavobacteriales bacterium]|nr:PqqD family protein [Flavobacteriales bacterium]
MPTYKIPTELLLQAVGDETVILDPRSGNYFTLDSIGTDMIQQFRENDSVEATAQNMSEKHDVSQATIHADLVGLLNEMADQGLVQKT